MAQLTKEQRHHLLRLEQQHRYREAYMFLMGIYTNKI